MQADACAAHSATSTCYLSGRFDSRDCVRRMLPHHCTALFAGGVAARTVCSRTTTTTARRLRHAHTPPRLLFCRCTARTRTAHATSRLPYFYMCPLHAWLPARLAEHHTASYPPPPICPHRDPPPPLPAYLLQTVRCGTYYRANWAAFLVLYLLTRHHTSLHCVPHACRPTCI